MSVNLPETPRSPADEQVFNVPNQITISRFVLAIVCFVLIGCKFYLAGMILFIIAASTDWIDGYWARRYKQITQLGRNLDPFVDKIIICGTYIFLAAERAPNPDSGVQAWVVVLVVGRELLVTALRSFLEQRGSDFSAAMSGKLKFVLQCVVAPTSLFMLSYGTNPVPDWIPRMLEISVWAMVAMTVYSGVAYLVAAARLLRQ